MAAGNRTTKKSESTAKQDVFRCVCCGREQKTNMFYKSDSDVYHAAGIIPYCKSCLENLFSQYVVKYTGFGYKHPERRAMERVCMITDLYYSDSIFNSASDKFVSDDEATLLSLYMRRVKLNQYGGKDYDTTIRENEKFADEARRIKELKAADEADDEKSETIEAATRLFGKGFEDEDYLFLYEQYSDWTIRHECKTKAQEEVFKQICFTQLELLKATRARADTKDLTATFQKLLETAKLQPKQNSGDVVSDAQTFGKLIDKWENTRPLPEIDEELKDVDKIGLYIDVFFRGHLAKMMNLKGGLSNLYAKFMKQYTVSKPEYNSDDMDEATFDAIFGNAPMDGE